MNETGLAQQLRDRIISDPEVILGDDALMRALIAANQQAMGANVVDLRGVAMERLERRLDRLEETHRTVIAAAYENLSGTNQIHRAVLKMLEPVDFDGFLQGMAGDVADILRVDSLHLVLEAGSTPATDATAADTLRGDVTETGPDVPGPGQSIADQERISDGELIGRRFGAILQIARPGFVADYMRSPQGRAGRTVVLRSLAVPAAQQPGAAIGPETDPQSLSTAHGAQALSIRSEALMRLDLGAGRLPAMLVLGSVDAQQFKPSQGTDLLAFFAGTFELAMRRWLEPA